MDISIKDQPNSSKVHQIHWFIWTWDLIWSWQSYMSVLIHSFMQLQPVLDFVYLGMELFCNPTVGGSNVQIRHLWKMKKKNTSNTRTRPYCALFFSLPLPNIAMFAKRWRCSGRADDETVAVWKFVSCVRFKRFLHIRHFCTSAKPLVPRFYTRRR